MISNPNIIEKNRLQILKKSFQDRFSSCQKCQLCDLQLLTPIQSLLGKPNMQKSTIFWNCHVLPTRPSCVENGTKSTTNSKETIIKAQNFRACGAYLIKTLLFSSFMVNRRGAAKHFRLVKTQKNTLSQGLRFAE